MAGGCGELRFVVVVVVVVVVVAVVAVVSVAVVFVAVVAVVVAVVAQIVVSCSKNGRARGAVREPPDPEIDTHFCGG